MRGFTAASGAAPDAGTMGTGTGNSLPRQVPAPQGQKYRNRDLLALQSSWVLRRKWRRLTRVATRTIVEGQSGQHSSAPEAGNACQIPGGPDRVHCVPQTHRKNSSKGRFFKRSTPAITGKLRTGRALFTQ